MRGGFSFRENERSCPTRVGGNFVGFPQLCDDCRCDKIFKTDALFLVAVWALSSWAAGREVFVARNSVIQTVESRDDFASYRFCSSAGFNCQTFTFQNLNSKSRLELANVIGLIRASVASGQSTQSPLCGT